MAESLRKPLYGREKHAAPAQICVTGATGATIVTKQYAAVVRHAARHDLTANSCRVLIALLHCVQATSPRASSSGCSLPGTLCTRRCGTLRRLRRGQRTCSPCPAPNSASSSSRYVAVGMRTCAPAVELRPDIQLLISPAASIIAAAADADATAATNQML